MGFPPENPRVECPFLPFLILKSWHNLIFFNDSVPNVNEKFDSRIKVKKTIVKGEPIGEPSVKAAV